jgi:hypothetical protein
MNANQLNITYITRSLPFLILSWERGKTSWNPRAIACLVCCSALDHIQLGLSAQEATIGEKCQDAPRCTGGCWEFQSPRGNHHWGDSPEIQTRPAKPWLIHVYQSPSLFRTTRLTRLHKVRAEPPVLETDPSKDFSGVPHGPSSEDDTCRRSCSKTWRSRETLRSSCCLAEPAQIQAASFSMKRKETYGLAAGWRPGNQTKISKMVKPMLRTMTYTFWFD